MLDGRFLVPCFRARRVRVVDRIVSRVDKQTGAIYRPCRITTHPPRYPRRVISGAVIVEPTLLIPLLVGIPVALGRLGLAADRLIGRAAVGVILFVRDDLGLVVEFQRRGRTFAAEVRDVGPFKSTGEASIFLAGQIGNRGRDAPSGPRDLGATDVSYTFFAHGQTLPSGGPHTVTHITEVAVQVLTDRLQRRADELLARALRGI